MTEPIPPEGPDDTMRVLNASRDGDALVGLAARLAKSEDVSALYALAGPSSNREFLARLDDFDNPAADMDNQMPDFPCTPMTYFVTAFSGEAVSQPLPVAIVSEQMIGVEDAYT